eukprot:6812849-Alexandrium_andersonii.AAC.1
MLTEQGVPAQDGQPDLEAQPWLVYLFFAEAPSGHASAVLGALVRAAPKGRGLRVGSAGTCKK